MVSAPPNVFVPLSVNVPLPALVIGAPPLPSLTTPEIVVLPLPSTVRALPLASTPPAPMVRRLPELFLQVWAPPTLTGAVIVRVNAFALSISMPRPAVPLIVLPASVSVTPEMVTFCPTLPVIQRPPAPTLPVRFGWLVNVPLKTALSLAPGLLALQLPFVPQVVLNRSGIVAVIG